MADLHGKVALVTGSSSGIGAALATALVPDACLGLVDARYCTGQMLLVDGGIALR